jgi:hypothetical protein
MSNTTDSAPDESSIKKYKLRMFQYPYEVCSFAGTNLVEVWTGRPYSSGVSRSEFYENGYRGGEYPGEKGCCDELGHELGQALVAMIGTILYISIGCVLSIAAFFLGAIVDAIMGFQNFLVKDTAPGESTAPAL